MSSTYSLTWLAADPTLNHGSYLSTYPHITPDQWQAEYGTTYPQFSASGQLPDAVAYGPAAGNRDAVTSLAPADLVLGQIVPFFVVITVNGDTTADAGTIRINTEWLTQTTSGANFGFDAKYGVLAAFISKSDAANVDPASDAQVKEFTSTIVNAGTSNEAIDGSFLVTGLQKGDTVVMEAWVVLDSAIDGKVTGNVQSSLLSAYAGASGSTKINTGNQTIPLVKVADFMNTTADLSVSVSDNTATLLAGEDADPTLHAKEELTYTLQASNTDKAATAYGVVVTDKLDSHVTFVSASNGGTYKDGEVTWNLGSMAAGQTTPLSVTVQVDSDVSAKAEITNTARIDSSSKDPNSENDTSTEHTILAASSTSNGDKSGEGDNGGSDNSGGNGGSDNSGDNGGSDNSGGNGGSDNSGDNGGSDNSGDNGGSDNSGDNGGSDNGGDNTDQPSYGGDNNGQSDNGDTSGEGGDGDDSESGNDDDSGDNGDGNDSGDGSDPILNPPTPSSEYPGAVQGTAFLDVPVGICASKLPGAVFANVTVNLLDATGATIATTTTDAQGNYQFTHVAPGTYQAQFVTPAGLSFIPQHSGQLHDGSDADPLTGSASFTISATETITGIDAGFAHHTATALDHIETQGSANTSYNNAVELRFEGEAHLNLNATGCAIIGGNGSLTVNANAGAAVLIGGTGYAHLNANSNTGSVLMGGQGGATMEGTGGNDIIIGGCGAISAQGLGSNAGAGLLTNLGADLMIGGKGNDTLEFNNSNGTVQGGEGDDYIHAAANGAVLAGGTNNGTISFNGTNFSNLHIGDTVNGTGADQTVLYQAGDGVQWIENFNPAAGGSIEVWGFAAPTATGMLNGMQVLYFGANQALVFNNFQPQNGAISGIHYHPESPVAPGAIDHISPLVPVLLGSGEANFFGAQGDEIVIGSNTATHFQAGAGNNYMVGGSGNDSFATNNGNGTFQGNGGDDSFIVGSGSNSIDGGTGTNQVTYGFARADATLHQLPNGQWEVLKPNGSVDLLANIAQVTFTDGSVNLAAATSQALPAPSNHAPVTEADTLAATTASTTQLGNVLANDQDPDAGTILHVTGYSIEGQHYAAGETATLASGAQFAISADGEVTLVQNHGYDGMAPGATDTLDFTYSVSDGAGLEAEGDASIELLALPPASEASTPPASEPSAPLAEEITQSGWGNHVEIADVAAGHFSHISPGQGNASVVAGNGDVHITLDGYSNSVQAGQGNHTVEGSLGGSTIQLGNGNNTVEAHGYGNHITTGQGSASIHAGEGNSSVQLGGGTAEIWLGGWGNTVDASHAGNVVIHAGAGNGLFIAPAEGVEHIIGFNLNGGDQLMFHGTTAAALSFQVSGADLHILLNGTEVADLVGLGNINPQSLADHHSLVFA